MLDETDVVEERVLTKDTDSTTKNATAQENIETPPEASNMKEGASKKKKKRRKNKRTKASESEKSTAHPHNTMDDLEDETPARKKATFAPARASDTFGSAEMRVVDVPPHRYTPLKDNWNKIFQPIVEHMKLQIRMNVRKRQVEIRTCAATVSDNALQKAHDFVKAFTLGFDVADAIALLRLDDLYLDTFDVKDVRPLSGDHLSRAIGRVAGKGGKTKFTIENATKTRIVLADTRVHILGAFDNIRAARTIISKLIIGSPPSKIYATLQTVNQRLSGRF